MVSWLKRNNHLAMAWFWMTIAVPVLIWWRDSIMVVLIMSLYANIEASFAAHHGSKDIQKAADDNSV